MGGRHDEKRRQAQRGPPQNPCMGCGACCTVFRASFYWAEADDATQGGVPVRLTVRVGALRRAMRRRADGRCAALRGVPGRKVFCTLYDRRPSVCRDFEPAWSGGSAGARCDEARARLGLPSCGDTVRKAGQILAPAREECAKALFGFTGCIFVV